MMNEREVIALQKQWDRLDRETVDAAVRALLEHSHGRKMLWWLLQIGKVGGQPFTSNALSTSFACGELNVGNQILAKIIEVDPAGYVQMMKESNDERSARDTALARARAGEPGDGSGPADGDAAD